LKRRWNLMHTSALVKETNTVSDPRAKVTGTYQAARTVFSILVSAGLLVAAGASPVEKTIETTPNPRISLGNIQGQVVVKGWNKSVVHATWSTASARVEVDEEAAPPDGPAERVRLSTHALDPSVTGHDSAADYRLDVPLNSSVEIRNPQGLIQVENLQGDATVESVGGKISMADIAGHLSVRSVGGDIEITRASGRVEAYSITGNLHFISPTSRKIRGTTTSGKITYEGDFAPGGDYSLSAYSGDLDVFCPANASFELNAKSVRGRLENSFPITPKRHAPPPPSAGFSLFGTSNSGTATVELTSYRGTIRIRRLP
jgi:hypothetical protein